MRSASACHPRSSSRWPRWATRRATCERCGSAVTDAIRLKRHAIRPIFEAWTPAGCARRAFGQALDTDCVELWACSLNTSEPLEAWLALLSARERDRAGRFMRADDRRRFAVAHGVMRSILAQYVLRTPPQVDIREERKGKPSLGGDDQATGYAFNLAHSADRALLGVAKDRSIGVDLEVEREAVDTAGIAGRFFTEGEQAAIAASPPGERRAAFFRHWVAKEAVLKAHGGGMTIPLENFSVVFDEPQVAHVRSLHAHAPGSEWVVRMLDLADGWHGAVAARGADWQLRIMSLTASPPEAAKK